MFTNIPSRFCAAHRTTISRIWTWLNVLWTYVIVICNCLGIFFRVRCEPLVFEYIVFQFWYCHQCCMIMIFNFDIVILVGWSCFPMYCNWCEIKFVCFCFLSYFSDDMSYKEFLFFLPGASSDKRARSGAARTSAFDVLIKPRRVLRHRTGVRQRRQLLLR